MRMEDLLRAAARGDRNGFNKILGIEPESDRFRDAITGLKTALEEGDEAHVNPCFVGLLGPGLDNLFAELGLHGMEHLKQDTDDLLEKAGRRDRMRFILSMNRNTRSGDDKDLEPEILEILKESDLDTINAAEFVVLISLLRLLSLADGTKRGILAGRGYYGLAEELAREILATLFPTVSLPSGDTPDAPATVAAPTAPTPLPTPAEAAEEPVIAAVEDVEPAAISGNE